MVLALEGLKRWLDGKTMSLILTLTNGRSVYVVNKTNSIRSGCIPSLYNHFEHMYIYYTILNNMNSRCKWKVVAHMNGLISGLFKINWKKNNSE